MLVLHLFIGLLENLPGQIDQALPGMLGMVLAEIKLAFEAKFCQPSYISMLFQVYATALYNNSVATLQMTEQAQ